MRTALAELHYQPNLPARYLRRPNVGVLALAIPEFNGYFADLSNEIIEAASTCGYTILLDPTRGERANEALVINGLSPHLIDGVIFNPQNRLIACFASTICLRWECFMSLMKPTSVFLTILPS